MGDTDAEVTALDLAGQARSARRSPDVGRPQRCVSLEQGWPLGGGYEMTPGGRQRRVKHSCLTNRPLSDMVGHNCSPTPLVQPGNARCGVLFITTPRAGMWPSEIVALLITLKLCRCIAIGDDRLLGRGNTGTARSASRFFWGSTSLQAIHCQLELTAMSPRFGPSAGAR